MPEQAPRLRIHTDTETGCEQIEILSSDEESSESSLLSYPSQRLLSRNDSRANFGPRWCVERLFLLWAGSQISRTASFRVRRGVFVAMYVPSSIMSRVLLTQADFTAAEMSSPTTPFSLYGTSGPSVDSNSLSDDDHDAGTYSG